MAVLAIKSEGKCKICTHSHRSEIDRLLELRSKKMSLDSGQKVNEEFVLKQLLEWGVQNPTKANITNHFRKHCEVVQDSVASDVDKAMSELSAEMLAHMDESDGSIDGDLRAIFKIGMKRIRGKIVQGQEPGVTLDHALKASAELTKRSHNEAQRELLGTLGAGLAAALTAPKPVQQIAVGAVEIIDQPAVEV